MANTIPMSSREHDRPPWLPWSAFPFQARFADIAGNRIHYLDEGSGPAVLLVSAGQWSFMFRDVIARLRGTLKVIASPPFGAVNSLTNVMARFTASRFGVGRHMSRADRRAFLGPWRSHRSRHATQQILAGVLRIDPLMGEVERSLPAVLAGLAVLTLFGRKNDPYGWQDRFGQIFPHAAAAGIPDGHHFPFNDDPDGYAAAISA